jgi:hypothetical protein
MIPDAYDLKRVVARHWPRFWCGEELRGLIAAPVYRFADQEAFDSDKVAQAGQRLAAGPLRLPHPRVIFEVKDGGDECRSLVAYAWEIDAAVDAILLARHRTRRLWSDVLVRGRFHHGGWAEVECNPNPAADQNSFGHCLTGLVWRALAILAEAGTTTEQSVSRVHRPKLASAGVRGWTWHQVQIVRERLVRASGPLGGSHASPRWHIRRGHWRQLADGRQVFVRACEVGDADRGGVLKDYLVGDRAA